MEGQYVRTSLKCQTRASKLYIYISPEILPYHGKRDRQNDKRAQKIKISFCLRFIAAKMSKFWFCTMFHDPVYCDVNVLVRISSLFIIKVVWLKNIWNKAFWIELNYLYWASGFYNFGALISALRTRPLKQVNFFLWKHYFGIIWQWSSLLVKKENQFNKEVVRFAIVTVTWLYF